MRRRVALGAVLSLVAAGAIAVPAAADEVNSGILTTARLTITSTSAVPTGSGLSGTAEFDPTNTTLVQGNATPSAVQLDLEGGTKNSDASVGFTAPTGTTFHDGFYFGNDVYGVRGLGSVDEAGSGCQYAAFTVTDVTYSGTTLTRLDIRFQTTCGFTSNVNATTFGELQLGEPEPSAGLTTNIRTAAWPDVPVGTRSTALWPVWIRNTAGTAVTLGKLTENGANPADFPVTGDGCSGRVLAAHSACQINLAFAPSAAKVRTAGFSLAAGAAAVTFTAAGTGTPGTTLLRMNSQPGDFVGGGLNYLITDAHEQMQVVDQEPGQFYATVQNPTNISDWWGVQISSPTGTLTPGTHATTAAGTSGSWELNVNGNGRGCGNSTGTVTVKQAAFDSDFAPTAVDITFSQTCTGSTAALTGEVEYHATSSTAPPVTPIVYASDTFARNVSSGLGTAGPTGQTWVTTASPLALGVTPGRATSTLAAGKQSGAYLSGVSHTGLEVDATIMLPKLPVGGSNGDYFYLYPRRVSATEQYGALARIDSSGRVFLTLVKNAGSATTSTISATVDVGMVSANQPIHLRVEATGTAPTTVRARGWLSGAEPGTWPVSTTDSTAALQTAGAPAFVNYCSNSVTNGPVVTAITGFVAESPLS